MVYQTVDLCCNRSSSNESFLCFFRSFFISINVLDKRFDLRYYRNWSCVPHPLTRNFRLTQNSRISATIHSLILDFVYAHRAGWNGQIGSIWLPWKIFVYAVLFWPKKGSEIILWNIRMVVLLNTSLFPALYAVKSLIVLCNQWNFYLLYGKKPFHKCIGTTVLRKWYHDPEMILPMLGIKCIQPGKASLKPNNIYICCFFRFWEFLLQWKNLRNKAFFLAWRAFQFSSIPKQIRRSNYLPTHFVEW